MLDLVTSSIVLTPKRHLLARKHVKIGPAVGPGRVPKTKGQDSQKSHKSIIFHTLGEKRDLRRNLHGSCRPRSNHVCRVLNSNFQFVTVLQISDFPIDSRIGLAKVLR